MMFITKKELKKMIQDEVEDGISLFISHVDFLSDLKTGKISATGFFSLSENDAMKLINIIIKLKGE